MTGGRASSQIAPHIGWMDMDIILSAHVNPSSCQVDVSKKKIVDEYTDEHYTGAGWTLLLNPSVQKREIGMPPILTTRRKSHRSTDAPNVRPCVVCHEDRPIVARGCCDRCRKKTERAENKLAFSPASNVDGATAHKTIGVILKSMSKCKVPTRNQKLILENFLPYTGLALGVQQAMIESIRHIGDDDAPDPWKSHAGSMKAPAGSKERVVEEEGRV